MPRTERKELRLTPELRAQVDEARGDVSFNRFVERALESALDGREVGISAKEAVEMAAAAKQAVAPSKQKPGLPSIADTWAARQAKLNAAKAGKR